MCDNKFHQRSIFGKGPIGNALHGPVYFIRGQIALRSEKVDASLDRRRRPGGNV